MQKANSWELAIHQLGASYLLAEAVYQPAVARAGSLAELQLRISKTISGPKRFQSKNFFGSKINCWSKNKLGLKNFGDKRRTGQKSLIKRNYVRKSLCQNNSGPKYFLSKKGLAQRIGIKRFWFKIFFDQMQVPKKFKSIKHFCFVTEMFGQIFAF